MATEVLEHATEERLTRQRATVEEFRSLPESVLPVEYINGEIIMSPSPTAVHQSASRRIFRALDKSVPPEAADRLFYAPLDVVLPSGDVVQPDLFFLSEGDEKLTKEHGRLHCVPLFVIEILSPGSVTLDTITKRDLYERNGVREYWIVDLETHSIAQLVLKKKHYALTELGESDVIKGVVLAGFESKVRELLGT